MMNLQALGSIKVWTNGYTYYWIPIRHLAPTENNPKGSYGIVRNHVYDLTLTKIMGLGVPVLDPDEIIIPETPEDSEQAFIAAKIKILSWRLVKEGIILGW